MCLANENLVYLFDNTFSYLLQIMFYQKQQMKVTLKKKIKKRGEIESKFLNTPSGGLKLNHYLV